MFEDDGAADVSLPLMRAIESIVHHAADQTAQLDRDDAVAALEIARDRLMTLERQRAQRQSSDEDRPR